MIRLESRTVAYAACNNGSSAVVTKEGQLFIFGKDTTFCDQSSGKELGIGGSIGGFKLSLEF